MNSQRQRIADLEKDIAILVLRLHGEPRESCSPEVNELLDTYPLDWALQLLSDTPNEEAEYAAELNRGYAKDRI